ncbi:hypothetical protein FHW83_005199 [Duganella sp. SG902]|uniref:hypothetical protein n=1 Tax=Duganella sp. SG902 TaxID=2587016 RepID=UPI00159DAF4A|nr:hypothetical protein [Duganella sp. SG902]NVM79360.1 hypothetical protein [Duganella sp. SG902]
MATQIKSGSTADPVQAQLAGIGERLHLVETDVAVIKSNYATREDIAKTHEAIAKLEARLIKWFVGTAVTLSAVVGTIAFTAAKFVH